MGGAIGAILFGIALIVLSLYALIDLNNADYIQTTYRTGRTFSSEIGILDYLYRLVPSILGGCIIFFAVDAYHTKED